MSARLSGRHRGVRGPAIVVGVAAGLTILAAPAAAEVDSPEQLPAPSTKQLASSVQQFAPSMRVWSPASRVRVWELDGDVRGVVTESVDGAESVISLATDLLFEFGKADLDPSTVATVQGAVADLPRAVAVSVEGHTDSIDTDAFNRTLSQQRAKAVADVIRQSRPDLRLQVKGFGEARPVAPNSQNGEDNPAGRALNRRVELRYDG